MLADMLEGKVGRIYMPKQDVGGMALHKMKARTPWLQAYLGFEPPLHQQEASAFPPLHVRILLS